MKAQTILFVAVLWQLSNDASERVFAGPSDGKTLPHGTLVSEDSFCGGWSPGNGVFVTINHQGEILASKNGIAQPSHNSGWRTFFRDLVFGNGQFVAVGGSYIDVTGVIVTSPDGLVWTRRNARSKTNLHGVTFGNAQFVAVGDAGTILTSIDGVTWVNRVSGSSAHLATVSFGHGVFVAGGESGTILTSTDGVHWNSQSLGPSVYVGRIVYRNGHFLVSQSGTAHVSVDGHVWHQTSGINVSN